MDYQNMLNEYNDSVVFQETESFFQAFKNMEEIRRQGKLCDVILKVEDNTFCAHKIVLAATIPYFYAMFTHDMIESKMTEITMQSIDPLALEALINYAYSGKILLNKNNVQNIMVGAAFLQLEKVRDACANFLCQRFHPQNVLGLRQFADTLACTNLYNAADKYIEQYFHEVSQSEEYLNLGVKELLSIIKRDELAVDSEEQVFEAIMRWVKHRENRAEDLPVLLSQVRLPLLTALYLTDRVATEELIRTSHKCRDLLDEARVYHLLPERRSLIQSFRTRPRSCGMISGQIFVVGGLTKHGDSLCTVESYDPSTGKWQTAQPMSMLRSRLGVAVLHGKLYACGGYNGSERLSTVEVLDPVRKEWSKVSPMHCKRSALGATALGKVIYVCGGYDGITSLNSVEKYCPDTDKWIMVAPMNKSRSAGAVVAFQGYVYALGGHDGLSIFNSVERYDPNLNSWVEMKPMLTRRCRLGVAALGGKLYACGGYDGTSFLQTVEVYDPIKDSWSFVSPMNAQRSRVALAANLGKLWAVGGYDGITNLVTVEVYDPATDSWSYVEPMCAHEGGVGVGVISSTHLFKDVFLAGLREPIGSVVRARNPDSIQSAFEYAVKEQNIHYHQRSYVQAHPKIIQNKPPPPRNIPQTTHFTSNTNAPQFVQRQPFIHNQFYQRQPTQQFRQRQLPKPTPMNIGSNRISIRHNLQQQSRSNLPQQPRPGYFQAQSKPTFTSKELNNIETQNYSSLDEYVEYNDGTYENDHYLEHEQTHDNTVL